MMRSVGLQWIVACSSYTRWLYYTSNAEIYIFSSTHFPAVGLKVDQAVSILCSYFLSRALEAVLFSGVQTFSPIYVKGIIRNHSVKLF